MANPMDEVAIEGVGFALGRPVERFAALESDIEEQLQANAGEDGPHADDRAGQGARSWRPVPEAPKAQP